MDFFSSCIFSLGVVVLYTCSGISQGEHTEIELQYDVVFPPAHVQKNLNPIILLHGMCDSRVTWKDIAPVIANETGRKVYLVDLRNHGDSPKTDEMSFDILAEDLDHFLIQHGIFKAILVGHSAGGKAVLTHTLKKPETVEKLIVEDMKVANIHSVPYGLVTLLLRLLKKSLQIIPLGTEKNKAQDIFIEFFLSKLPDYYVPCQMSNFDILPVKQDGGQYTWKTNIDAIEKTMTAGTDGNIYTQNMSSYNPYLGEALFLYGTRSPFQVDKDKSILKYFPHARKLGFKGASHLVHHEFTEDFTKEIIHFINSRLKPKRSKCPKEGR